MPAAPGRGVRARLRADGCARHPWGYASRTTSDESPPAESQRRLGASAHIGLLDVDPDLGQYLTEAEREEAERRVFVPVRRVAPGKLDFPRDLDGTRTFGAIVVGGILVRRVRVGAPMTLRLLGPGDTIGAPNRESPMLIESTLHVLAEARLVVLDDELLAAVQRWPRLVTGLFARCTAQSDRLLAQMTISQLPRVADRLLAVLWLLAESWGRVTPGGVVLPLSLTHDLLGGLIGARRPTVTLAISELVERGAVIRQDGGWLLLEALAERTPSGTAGGHVSDVSIGHGPWSELARNLPGPDHRVAHAELLATVRELRERHEATRDRFDRRLAAIRSARERVIKARDERRRSASTLLRLHEHD